MLTRPRDREVVCHASAWDMDDTDDVRIKMCIKPIEEDLFTVYHELGHVYYYLWYKDQPHPVPGRRARRLPRSHRRRGQSFGDAGLSAQDRPGRRRGSVEGSHHQPADEDGARQGRLPAVRQAHRRVALGRVRRPHQARGVQQGVVGAAREIPGRERPGGAQRGGFRSGREVPHPGQHAVHAVFPLVHPAVPVPQGAVRRRRLQGSAARVFDLRQHRRPARSTARCWRRASSQPWPDTLEQLTGTREMDASAILDYFKPLEAWLEEQNDDQKCGWN